MKIIAGKYKGRKLALPKTARTRPMSDKVREALFNIIGDLTGLTVLDTYAGSGAIAFESLSRGARLAIAVENAKLPAKAIRSSQQLLNLSSEFELIESTVERYCLIAENNYFDLIVADPPYEEIDYKILNQLGGLLTNKGTLVVSHTSRIAAPELESMERINTRKYGDSSLSSYVRN